MEYFRRQLRKPFAERKQSVEPVGQLLISGSACWCGVGAVWQYFSVNRSLQARPTRGWMEDIEAVWESSWLEIMSVPSML